MSFARCLSPSLGNEYGIARFAHEIARQRLTLRYYSHNGAKKLLPTPPDIHVLETPAANDSARSWAAAFERTPIPRGAVELAFSRSSGPGGQNVNKVNTKATIKCAIGEEWIPPWTVPLLKKSSYYVSSSQSIQITSSVHRSQSQNVDECLSKFHALILDTSRSLLKNEPSDAQRKKVEGLIKASAQRRRMEKTARSNAKASRKPPRD